MVDMQWCVKGASTQSLYQAPCAWCGSGTVSVCVSSFLVQIESLFATCNDTCPAISIYSNIIIIIIIIIIYSIQSVMQWI